MNKRTKLPKLIDYKNVKQYLLGTVVLFIVSQIFSFASAALDVKTLVDASGKDYERSGMSVGLEIVSWVIYLIFFVILTLLLLQIVQYQREKN